MATTTLTSSSRPPYTGESRKLVVAFDVGTTFSGISYSLLDPDLVPQIKRVTRFPDQSGGDAKIPTILFYDKQGIVCAAGAETESPFTKEKAADEGWSEAKWFKMHLRPKSKTTDDITKRLPPLPPNKTAVEVLADFLNYLHRCTKQFIQESHQSGDTLWPSVENSIEYVFTHPNGWEGAQQQDMRRAAKIAGLVEDAESKRIHFVTEGEASLHFCLEKGLGQSAMQNGNGVLIVDAGGGTIDISAYAEVEDSGSEASSDSGLSTPTETSEHGVQAFREVAMAQCYFEGSIFVTQRARQFIEDLLQDSEFSNKIDKIVDTFDRSSKLIFRNDQDRTAIRFGNPNDKDLELGIRSGTLRLSGNTVAEFFRPSIDCIIRAIIEQRDRSDVPVATVFLVGGFAASDWLYTKLSEFLAPSQIEILRPDNHWSKAVADGGVSFYLDHSITSRISKAFYGTPCNTRYDDDDEEHRTRKHTRYRGVHGQYRVPGAFSVILPKHTSVSALQEFSCSLNITRAEPGEHAAHVNISSYHEQDCPNWVDDDEDNFRTNCRISFHVQLSSANKKMDFDEEDGHAVVYYQCKISVVLLFGLTEFKASVRWEENMFVGGVGQKKGDSGADPIRR